VPATARDASAARGGVVHRGSVPEAGAPTRFVGGTGRLGGAEDVIPWWRRLFSRSPNSVPAIPPARQSSAQAQVAAAAAENRRRLGGGASGVQV
jgi:hypothetical protein